MNDAPAAAVDPSHRPIGVFDSGLGGLTVMRSIMDRLPGESLLYFGDTARVPYGTKSAEAVRHFSLEAAHFLFAQGVKAVVVACNTATAHALEALQEEAPVPVIGVVDAGARAAAGATETHRVGIIGTPGTIGSGAYDLALRQLVEGKGLKVYAQSCPLFVPLVEEGLASHPATALIAREYLAPLKDMHVDVLVLGCTHYPLLRPLVAEVMGPQVRLVDSGEETALELARMLEAEGLLNTSGGVPEHRFTASDLPIRFRTVGRRFLGDRMGKVERVHVEGCLEDGPSAW